MMGKRRRGNNEGSIYVRKSDGLWTSSIIINGERVSFYGHSYNEVKGKLDTAKDQARDGIFTKSTKQNFGEWLDYWLNEIAKPKIKPATFDYYEYIIRFHIKPELGKLSLNKLTTELLDQFYNQKKQDKKQRQAKQENGEPGEAVLSKKLVGDIRKVIGMALKKAVIKKRISFNPNDYTESIGKDEPEIEYLTPEEIADFLDKISNDFWYPAFVIALGTGIRVGELAALQWKHVDFKNGFLKVCQSAVQVNTYETQGPKTKLIIQTPKTKRSNRRVPLPLDAIKALKAAQARQQEFKGGANELPDNVIKLHDNGNELNDEEFVFSWPDGRMIDPNFLSKHFKKLVKKLGFKDVHFHCLRHYVESQVM
jgi:integrase